MSFYKVNDIDFSKLKFSKTKNLSGRRFILAYYEKKSFGLKLPKLRIPFDSKVNQYDQLEINISLGKNEELINKLTELDECMKKFATECLWFDNQDFEYSPMVRGSSDFPPIIKMKVPFKDNIIKTVFYDENKRKIEVKSQADVTSLISKGTQIQSAIECVGVWFNDNKFGLTCKAEQIRIMSKPQSYDNDDNYLFCSDSENDLSDSELKLLIDDE